MPRGKYLVSDAGEMMFRVDSSVGDYPWKLESAKGSVPADTIQKTLAQMQKDLVESGQGGTAALETELGIDRQEYRVIALGSETNGLRQGRYLIDASNNVAYFARPLEKYDAPKAHLFQLIIDGILGGKLNWGLVLIGVF